MKPPASHMLDAVELPRLDPGKMPRHIAIIMDGNGRWARRHGVSRAQGHETGAQSARAIIEACKDLHVPYLSLYAFSTENWRRSRMEVSALFRLLSKYINLELEELHRQGVRITMMGRLDGLPPRAIKDLRRCVELTRDNGALVVNVAINYGSRQEIVDACRAIARDVAEGRLRLEDIDDSSVAQRLYVPELPDPDLLIRTSGELRLSNFMLWQLSYAEIVAPSTLWPDFRKPDLMACIAEYQSRNRRFGGR